jgi:hypothetical protein
VGSVFAPSPNIQWRVQYGSRPSSQAGLTLRTEDLILGLGTTNLNVQHLAGFAPYLLELALQDRELKGLRQFVPAPISRLVQDEFLRLASGA